MVVKGADFLIKFLNSLLNNILGCLGFKPEKVLAISITVGNEVLILCLDLSQKFGMLESPFNNKNYF